MLAVLGPLALGISSASAESARNLAPPASLDDLKHRDQQLQTLRAEQKKALETEAQLKREIEAIGDDRRKFNEQIIDTAARVTAIEDRIAKAEERLAPLTYSEEGLRASLERRRDTIAEILAALQRIGRHPASALVVPAFRQPSTTT